MTTDTTFDESLKAEVQTAVKNWQAAHRAANEALNAYHARSGERTMAALNDATAEADRLFDVMSDAADELMARGYTVYITETGCDIEAK